MTSVPRRAARWLVLPLVAAAGAVWLASPAQAQDTLRAAAADDFLVGAAVTPDLLNNPTYANIAAAEFSSVTAENHMKWDTVEPNPGQFNFGPGDQIVQFAQQNDQHVYGHTLVWHNQTPSWVQQLSGDALLQAMQNHITEVMQHWPDVGRWDVVNEAVSDNNGQLRDSFWLRGLGQGYIAQALQAARAADPDATLCLNDYSIDGINAKSNAYFTLVQQLMAQGVPIDCMSFQAHLILGQVPGDMQQNLQRFRELGLEIWVTELDIRIPEPVDQQELQQQANDYRRVFEICQNVGCAGVTTWGVHDAQSWVDSTFPEFDAPLLWDDNFNRKPAYSAVLDQLGGSAGDPDPPPVTEDCQVTYQASNWGGTPGFTARVTVTNTGDAAINGWTAEWDYPAGQTATPPGWNATVSQSGPTVTAENAAWNGTLAPDQSATFGFNGTAASAGNNPSPTTFTLNDTSCTVN